MTPPSQRLVGALMACLLAAIILAVSNRLVRHTYRRAEVERS